MTTITLEVPDDLAALFEMDSARLPALIREVLEAKLAKHASPANDSEPIVPVYQEMIDFLSSAPTRQKIIDFKISASAQERLEDLLYTNREEELTQDERTELETYLQFSHLLTQLKARARGGQPFLG